MAARRSGFDSLVHKHQLEELWSRTLDTEGSRDSHAGPRESASARDSTPKPGYRRNYGDEGVAKVASAVEQSAPWAAGVFDIFWPRVLDETSSSESKKPEFAKVERPRPDRKTVDLTEVTDKYEEHIKKLEDERKLRKKMEDQKNIEEKDRIEREMEAEANVRAKDFAEGIERMRFMFLGRPAQQLRLLKRGLQIDRNKAEYNCSLWKHLLEDSKREKLIQEELFNKASKRNNEAATRADSLRGKERGARQAAMQLKACQLLDGSRKALTAADSFAHEAAIEEEKARVARAEKEDANENVQQEEEKIRACEAQIEFNKGLARQFLEDAVQREREEIKAVLDEENRLIEVRPKFEELLNNAPILSSLAKSCQDDVDRIDRRLALIAMEQEMFRPSYLRATTSPNQVQNFYDVFKQDNIEEKIFEWIETEQLPGVVCLGRRGKEPDGVLYRRSRVVERLNQLQDFFDAKDANEFDSKMASVQLGAANLKPTREQLGWKTKWVKILRDLVDPSKHDSDKKQVLELWNSLGEERLADIQERVEITSDYFAKENVFESRTNKERKQGKRTLLDKKLFGRMWEEGTCIVAQRRHYQATHDEARVAELEKMQREHSHVICKGSEPENIAKVDRVVVRMRNPLEGLWLTSWIQPDKSKPTPLNNNPYLGPMLSRFEPVDVPQLHDDDSKGQIDDGDGRPRRYAILWSVEKKLGDNVKVGDLLIVLRVFDERKLTKDGMRGTVVEGQRGKGPEAAAKTPQEVQGGGVQAEEAKDDRLPQPSDEPKASAPAGGRLASLWRRKGQPAPAIEGPPGELLEEDKAPKGQGPAKGKKDKWPSPDYKKILAPASGKFTGLCPAVWKRKKEGADEEGPAFAWGKPKTHGFLDKEWIEEEKSRKSNNPDMLHNYNLKFFSTETIAYIEQGEPGWESRVLPVAEWPDLFFKDFKHFFRR